MEEQKEQNFFDKFGLEVTSGDVEIGQTYPIYGMITKVLAAKRAGVQLVLLPRANQEEVDALEADVLEGVRLQLVASAGEIIEPLFARQTFILAE